MQTLFNKPRITRNVVETHTRWRYARDGLQANLAKIQEYYRSRPMAVKSNHILARLLNSLGVSHANNLERFYDIADGRSLNSAMGMKIASTIYRGAVFENTFYGAGVKEIILTVTEFVDPKYIEDNWQTYQSVKVLDHPFSNLQMMLPNGKNNCTEKGYAVICIDIPALAVQFRRFAQIEHERMLKGDSPKSLPQFIHMYVLPNMLPTHLDVALINRAVNLAKGAPMGSVIKSHPFYLHNYEKDVDTAYADMTKKVANRDRAFEYITYGFPAVNKDNFGEVLKLPPQAPTRQVAWIEVVSRLKALDWLTTISPSNLTKYSQVEMNYLIKLFMSMSSDNEFAQLANKDWYLDAIATVRAIAARISTNNYHYK